MTLLSDSFRIRVSIVRIKPPNSFERFSVRWIYQGSLIAELIMIQVCFKSVYPITLPSLKYRICKKVKIKIYNISQWIMTYLAWGRQGLFPTFFKVVLHKRHCCWPTTYFLPFLSLLMNIISWKIEATQTWGHRNMLRLLKTASGS